MSSAVPPPENLPHAPSLLGSFSLWMKATRLQQWIKNILVFLPLVFAHHWRDMALLLKAVMAFASFSVGASAIYLINDCLDVEADRLHPRRKFRPVASGRIPLRIAWMLSAFLLFDGLVLALQLSFQFALVYLSYVVAAVLYSVRLKRVVMLDVFMLAGFYTIRIYAGSVAANVAVSNWLMLFAMFFFLSLAFQKRTGELRVWDQGDKPLRRRGYVRQDLDHLNAMGISSGYIAVLVFALYIHSPDVTKHYARPDVLWWACPCLLYWVSRLALLAGRGEVSEDAISFAFRDKTSYAIGALILAIIMLANPI